MSGSNVMSKDLIVQKKKKVEDFLFNFSVYEEKNCTKLEVHRQLGHLLNHIQHWGSDDYILLLSNAVFVQDKFLLKTTYKHALWDFYKTPVIPVDFT